MSRRVGERLHAVVAEWLGLYGAAPTCHLSALARVEGYTPAVLERAVVEERRLVRVRAMRRSVHLLDHDLLRVAVPAIHETLVKPFRTASRRLDVDYGEMARRVEEALADGPLPAADVRRQVDPERALGGSFQILLGRMAAENRIVRAGTTGSWRSDRLTWALWGHWLPGVEPLALEVDEARRRLAAAYVGAFGPVTLDDLAWWTGWTKTAARAATDGLDLERPGSAPASLRGLRLLPVWDVLMVAYRHRDRLLDPAHHRFVYDRSGNATSVVLDGGRVVGVWDLGRTDDPLALRVAPLGPWPRGRWDDVHEQAHRIAAMLGSGTVTVERVPEPVDLTTARRNRFLSPLGD